MASSGIPVPDHGRHLCKPQLRICDFLREHPTLQQRMIGLFVQVIAKTGRYLEIKEDVRFPFI